jgi:hypothetical protein
MKQYKYETYILNFSIWTGRTDQDFLNIINEYGSRGWRFVSFAPGHVRPKGVKGIEIIFEKEVED